MYSNQQKAFSSVIHSVRGEKMTIRIRYEINHTRGLILKSMTQFYLKKNTAKINYTNVLPVRLYLEFLSSDIK